MLVIATFLNAGEDGKDSAPKEISHLGIVMKSTVEKASHTKFPFACIEIVDMGLFSLVCQRAFTSNYR